MWWALAVAVAVGAGLLIARSRGRRAERARLRAAEAEVAWLARELLPQLVASGSVERMAGGWQIARARVTAAEDELTLLESEGRDTAVRGRAGDLRAAARDARTQVDELSRGRPEDAWAQVLAQVLVRLEAILAADRPAG